MKFAEDFLIKNLPAFALIFSSIPIESKKIDVDENGYLNGNLSNYTYKKSVLLDATVDLLRLHYKDHL